MKIERINVLGVGISAINLNSAKQVIVEAIRAGRKGYVCVTGVHGVMESQNDRNFLRFTIELSFARPMECQWFGLEN
jgi:hypothetical protein